MQFSAPTLLAIFASAVSTVNAAATPLSSGQIDFFNSMITGMIPKINTDLPALIKAKGWDPKENVSQKTFNLNPSKVTMDGCPLSVSYSISNLVGLSTVLADSIKVTSGDQLTPDTYNFNLNGFTKPTTLTANIGGTATVSCPGAPPKSFKVIGAVMGTGLKGSIQGTVTAQITPKNATLSAVKISSFTPDIVKIDVSFQGLDPAIQKQMNDMISEVTTEFKAKAQELASSVVTEHAGAVINKHLPLTKTF